MRGQPLKAQVCNHKQKQLYFLFIALMFCLYFHINHINEAAVCFSSFIIPLYVYVWTPVYYYMYMEDLLNLLITCTKQG